MKILHINNTFKIIGGTERYLDDLTALLEDQGHVVYRIGQDFENCREGFDIKVEGFEYIKNTSQTFTAINNFIHQVNPDVVHVHNIINTLLMSRLIKAFPKLVRTLHSFYTTCPQSRWLPGQSRNCLDPMGLRCFRNGCLHPSHPKTLIKALLKMIWEPRIHARTERVLVASRFMKDLLGKLGYEISNIHVLPYFFKDFDQPQVPLLKRAVMFVGRVIADKGIYDFLQMIQTLPQDTEVHIVGDGPDMSKMKELIGKMEYPIIHLHGWLDRKGLIRCYDNSCVVVVPSLWMEPFGIIGLEAMARSRPIIAYEVGGIPEWLSHGKTGFLVPLRDIDDMGEKCRILLEDLQQAKNLGDNGRIDYEKRFTPEVHLKQLLELYRNQS
ncbi:MAG: glycosyltransferase family 4 protein [Planctomycetes bacterium]|nr:glycosyltransferase family 4 protein [Planctomycetota bacterium]